MKEFISEWRWPLIGIAVVLLLVGMTVGAFLIFGGGDGDVVVVVEEEDDPELGVGEGDPTDLPGRRRGQKEAPRVRSGVVDEARRVGRLAVAQSRGTIVNPSAVTIRVSAAPKQTVTVNWQLGCFRDRRARVGRGQYRARPPDTRQVPLPMQGATSCIATASAQLTDPDREGRVKVAVIAG